MMDILLFCETRHEDQGALHPPDNARQHGHMGGTDLEIGFSVACDELHPCSEQRGGFFRLGVAPGVRAVDRTVIERAGPEVCRVTGASFARNGGAATESDVSLVRAEGH